jgi:uncharacterized protein
MIPAGKPHVLIAGGSGLIGTALRDLLQQADYTVTILSRKGGKPGVSAWDPDQRKIDADLFSKADILINLSGEGIANKRWSAEAKERIRSSRIIPTAYLGWCLNNMPNKIHSVIQISATGYYGNTGSQVMTEEVPPADDFMGITCAMWENAARAMEAPARRLVVLRTGIILSLKGGFLKETVKPMRAGIIPVFGNGTQFIPWIHIDDYCSLVLHLIQNSKYRGTYNAVAPAAVSCSEMARAIKDVSGSNALIMKIPAFVLNVMLGEMSQLLLHGQHASASKILQSGYRYKYNTITEGLSSLLPKKR